MRYLVDVNGEVVDTDLTNLQAHRLAWECMRDDAEIVDICAVDDVHNPTVVWVKCTGDWKRNGVWMKCRGEWKREPKRSGQPDP